MNEKVNLQVCDVMNTKM